MLSMVLTICSASSVFAETNEGQGYATDFNGDILVTGKQYFIADSETGHRIGSIRKIFKRRVIINEEDPSKENVAYTLYLKDQPGEANLPIALGEKVYVVNKDGTAWWFGGDNVTTYVNYSRDGVKGYFDIQKPQSGRYADPQRNGYNFHVGVCTKYYDSFGRPTDIISYDYKRTRQTYINASWSSIFGRVTYEYRWLNVYFNADPFCFIPGEQ